MSNYSEMNFLFGSNGSTVSTILNNTSKGNTVNIIKGGNTYIVYKNTKEQGSGTRNIQKYLSDGYGQRSGIYKNENTGVNPYIQMIQDFNTSAGTPGAGLKINASDLVYLRDLGVYPMNRMAILRRFPIGVSLTENLEEMKLEPISTIIGWIKPDQAFGTISFNENWTRTNKRFDQKLMEIISQYTGGVDISKVIPLPDFAQGVLFEFYKRMNLTQSSGVNDSVNETYEYYDANSVAYNGTTAGKDQNLYTSTNWGLNNIPIGDPNLLHEGPFRDPEGQNIQSSFSFDLTTTYEQKLLGDVDPGSAMLDILDNIYAMGTSDMVFYWGDASPSIIAARNAANEHGNELQSWWVFVYSIMDSFWTAITDLFNEVKAKVKKVVETVTTDIKAGEIKKAINGVGEDVLNVALGAIKTILTSTVAIHRFELRGSIELMVGGKISSTPWHLTIGNPYAPWLSTNHIIVKSATVETSTEMGFNDQPQWLTAKFNCEFSRSLGKQELMRMFNNTYRRTYSTPPSNIAIGNIKGATNTVENKTSVSQGGGGGLKKQS